MARVRLSPWAWALAWIVPGGQVVGPLATAYVLVSFGIAVLQTAVATSSAWRPEERAPRPAPDAPAVVPIPAIPPGRPMANVVLELENARSSSPEQTL